MARRRQSDIFKTIFMLWKVLGVWFGRNPNKKQKYCSCVNVFINQVLYSVLLTVNLYFTPLEIKYLVPELSFYFTEIAIMSKVFMIIIMRDKMLEALNIMDGKDLEGDDEATKKIIKTNNANFSTFWKLFNVLAALAYSSLVFVPVILHCAINVELKLPISQYYFLSEENRENYLYYLYFYQSFAIYGHMMYNISVDTFVAGLLLVGVSQLRVLNYKLKNLKLSDAEKMLSLKAQDEIQTTKLRELLLRYGVILRYCSLIHNIISFNMFVVFGLGSAIICVTLCELLFLPTEIGFFICMTLYLVAMTMQIFIPAYLGSLINHENSELVFAAYCTEWIPRSKSFKNNLRIFVERVNSPIQLTGLKIFTMSLATFTSIVKTAYSFFTLLRNFHE